MAFRIPKTTVFLTQKYGEDKMAEGKPKFNSIVDVVGNVEELRELCNEVKDALDSNNARLAAILLDSVPGQYSLAILYADVYRHLRAECEKANEHDREMLESVAETYKLKSGLFRS